ncbi:MAG: DNA-binding domain-containing protein [Pontibacterium sp.]
MTAVLPDSNDFQALQYRFAAHIRHPEKHAKPAGIEERRMNIYRELFYNNIEGFLAGNFPVFKSLCSDDYWHRTVRDFFDRHRSHTPYFLEIGEQFIAYVNGERLPDKDDQPFMKELLHYEWVELALDASELELSLENVDENGDFLTGHPVQSPLAWSLAYQYPVHCIRPDFLPQEAGEQPTYLMAYRDRKDEVQFMETNPVTARLLYLLSESPDLTGRAVLQQIADEMQHPAPEQVVAGGLQTLEQLRVNGVILGTTR